MHFGGSILYAFALTWGVSLQQLVGNIAKVENPINENGVVLSDSVLELNEQNRDVHREEIRILLNGTDYLSKSGGMLILI